MEVFSDPEARRTRTLVYSRLAPTPEAAARLKVIGDDPHRPDTFLLESHGPSRKQQLLAVPTVALIMTNPEQTHCQSHADCSAAASAVSLRHSPPDFDST